MSTPSAALPLLGHIALDSEPNLPVRYEPTVPMRTNGQYQCPFVGCAERPPSKPFSYRDALMRHLQNDHPADYAFGHSDEGDCFLPSSLQLSALNTYRNQLSVARGNAALHSSAPAEVRRALEDTVQFPQNYFPIIANMRTGAHQCPVLGCNRGSHQPFTQTARLKSHFMTHHFAEYDNGFLRDNGDGTFTSPSHNPSAYNYHEILTRARIEAAIEASQPKRRSRANGPSQMPFLAAAALSMQPAPQVPAQQQHPGLHRMVPVMVDPSSLPVLQQLEARDAMLAAQSALTQSALSTPLVPTPDCRSGDNIHWIGGRV